MRQNLIGLLLAFLIIVVIVGLFIFTGALSGPSLGLAIKS